MQVMLSLKDSRHGLSSIYSLFLHFEKSATFGTVGYSKVFYGNTQWNFSLCWSAWTFFSFSSSFLHAVTLLSASMLATKGGWRLQAMRSWRIQQAQTNSAFFKFTALFAWLRMSFVWLWMSPQESKGVYKLVPVASQIFLLTVAQLFCLSLTSRSEVTLSRVTLLLITQWLRHLFRWANASASDYCIISSPLLQLYIQRVCEEREAFQHCSCSSIEGHQWLHRSKTAHACTHLCKGSIGRSRCECTTRTLLLFAGVEQKPHVQTKLDNLLVLQSLLKCRKILCFSESLKQSCLNFPLSGFHAWIFLSQVFMPEFSSLGFHYRCDC